MKLSRKVKIALVQTTAGANPEENLQHQVALLRRAADQGGQILCTQELFPKAVPWAGIARTVGANCMT